MNPRPAIVLIKAKIGDESLCQQVGQFVLHGKLRQVSELWVSKVQQISLFSIFLIKVSSILSQILLKVDLIVSVFADESTIEMTNILKEMINKQTAY